VEDREEIQARRAGEPPINEQAAVRLARQIQRCLVHLHAVEQVLIETGTVSKSHLIERIKEAQHLPEQQLGMQVLQTMLKGDEADGQA